MRLYHTLNRGVEKRDIFLDDQDRGRFVHDMYEFNDMQAAKNISRTMSDLRGRSFARDLLVDIHAWCLMGNHYHLLLSERKEGGLTKFIMKLNVGYAKYFNEKYKRSGALYQGRTKKVPITSDGHFQYILHYIHLNPLDFSSQHVAWREGRLPDARAALEYLEQYRWSSYADYCGRRNFPSIITKELFSNALGIYKEAITKYLRSLEDEPALHSNLE